MSRNILNKGLFPDDHLWLPARDLSGGANILDLSRRLSYLELVRLPCPSVTNSLKLQGHTMRVLQATLLWAERGSCVMGNLLVVWIVVLRKSLSHCHICCPSNNFPCSCTSLSALRDSSFSISEQRLSQSIKPNSNRFSLMQVGMSMTPKR